MPGRRNTEIWTGASTAAKIFVCLASLIVIVQSWELVHRVHSSRTDFTDFYQDAVLARSGSATSLYADPLHHCIPPAGLLMFRWAPLISPAAAAFIWALVNIGLLLLCVRLIRSVFSNTERHRSLLASTGLWATGLLFVLAAGSLQVGQLSVLFITCWLFYLLAAFRRQNFSAATLLVIPGVIKIYPLLLVSVPYFLGRKRQIFYGIVAFMLLGILLPVAVYGHEYLGLTENFAHNVLLNRNGRMAQCVYTGVTSNASIDVVMLRYLSRNSDILAIHPSMPHLNISKTRALWLAQLLRLAILATTIIFAHRWMRRKRTLISPKYAAILLLALWCVALYLVLPETKSRYAVYTFPAFIPLLESTAAAGAMRKWLRYVGLCLLTVACTALVIEMVPGVIRMAGIPALAPLFLWIFCLIRIR